MSFTFSKIININSSNLLIDVYTDLIQIKTRVGTNWLWINLTKNCLFFTHNSATITHTVNPQHLTVTHRKSRYYGLIKLCGRLAIKVWSWRHVVQLWIAIFLLLCQITMHIAKNSSINIIRQNLSDYRNVVLLGVEISRITVYL